jgi:ABC-type transport system involved in multi-copper enzyme maturation permease subunit
MFAVLKKAWPQSGWLTGPIFGKELRVSSRRRRNYWLRSVYVLLLTVFVTVVWMSIVDYRGTAAFQQSRMAAAGKQIVTTIVIFQFVATQVLAVIMLSTAISDEVYHRTLGLLMTTPISSLQIVMGKVLSKLLQLLLLLAITLPVLAIVRVFGGVSLGYLLSSFCITLTAVLLAGALSLAFSISNRRAYAVIVRTTFVLGCFYFALPLGVAATLRANFVPGLGILGGTQSSMSNTILVILAHLNPFCGIFETTWRAMTPGRMLNFHWPLHCVASLGMTLVILGWAVRVVRNVALRQATGQLNLSGKAEKTRKKRRGAGPAAAETLSVGPVKRVVGPPVIWKELRAPFIQGVNNRNSYIGLSMAVLALLVTYAATAREGVLDENFAHTSYGLLFVLMGIIFSVVFSATQITSERESQTWPLLLATSLRDRDILLGKAVSAFRRCLPIWGLLAGHMVLFVLVGYIHPIAIVHVFLVVIWITCFIIGAGLYFSTRFARTTSSVVASFALVVGLWIVGPTLVGMLSMMGKQSDLSTDYLWFHPVTQIVMIMEGEAGVQNAELPLRALRFEGRHGLLRVGRMTGILAGVALVYVLAALFFFWRAKCRLRKSVF